MQFIRMLAYKEDDLAFDLFILNGIHKIWKKK